MPLKVYLDMNCWNRPYDNQEQPRIQQEALHVSRIIADHEKYTITWSYILAIENADKTDVFLRSQVDTDSLSASMSIIPHEDIDRLVTQIMSVSRIKQRGAYHLACAITADCDYFVTCDDRLKHRYNNIRTHLGFRIVAVYPDEI